eukprot:3927568-Alexandrium_andersonii.AAC.1
MSASLVGSEMCIRDSDRPAPKAEPASLLGGSLDEVWTRQLDFAGGTCLLYTSDAADDCSV